MIDRHREERIEEQKEEGKRVREGAEREWGADRQTDDK